MSKLKGIEIATRSFALVLAASALLAGVGCGSSPAKAGDAALQSSDLTGFKSQPHRCALSGSIENAVSEIRKQGNPAGADGLQKIWSSMKAVGAQEGTYVAYVMVDSDCFTTSFGPSMASRVAVLNMVFKFDTEQHASAAWQSGAITGGANPTQIATLPGVQAGAQTGLGVNSWTVAAQDGTTSAAWSINKYCSVLGVWGVGGAVQVVKDLAAKVKSRQGPSSSGQSATISSPSISTTPNPKAGTTKALAGHGLLACANSGSLMLIDPQSGSAIATAPVTANLPTGWTSGFGCGGLRAPARALLREQFSQDLSRMTVTGPQPDGSQHVGYVDLATGVLTDVTAAHHSSTGFGATLPMDCSPVFGPTSNTFWFLEGPTQGTAIFTVHRVDLTSGAETTRGTIQINSPSCSSVSTKILVWASDQVDGLADFYGPDAVLPNPSGTLGATRCRNCSGGVTLFTSPAGQAINVRVKLPAGTSNGGNGLTDCIPEAWAGDSTLICTLHNVGISPELVVVQLSTSATSVQATYLLPTNTRRNFSPVVSPDGSMVAFGSEQGSVVALYTVALGNAGTEPKLVAPDLAFSLISWQ